MKRILSALLAVSLTASLMLSGCSETPTPTTTAPAVTTAPTTVPTTVPPETTVPMETTPPPATVPVVTEPVETTVPETSEPDDSQLTVEERNSLNMLNYLAVIAEEIRASKNNRLILEDIYTELINEIHPGAVDENTQQHLANLREIISNFQSVETKRERLQYIHNQDMAAAMRSAVPNPLSVLSVSNALDWKRLAISVTYTVVDSYTKYKSAVEDADMKYLTSGWELDDIEEKILENSRGYAFDYMLDITQEYDKSFGDLTLNETAVKNYAEYITITDEDRIYEKIGILESTRNTYQNFSDYWIEMADCYYDVGKYQECLDCIETYYSLNTDIFRKDYNVVRVLPKAINAVQILFEDDTDKYIYLSELYAAEIEDNINDDAWSLHYFAAQVYLDLYQKTNSSAYLDDAYKIIKKNVAHLIDGQRKLNDTYEKKLEKLILDEPDYEFMSKNEKAIAETEYKTEKARIDSYNAELEEIRKTELPSLYEPLILNCDLLLALAEKKGIDASEKTDINNLLKGVFLSKPVAEHYSFNSEPDKYSMTFKADKMVIPANLLTPEATFSVTVSDNNGVTPFNDWKVSEVVREGDSVSSFYAHVTSESILVYKWTVGTKVSVQINNGEKYDPLEFDFTLTEYTDNWSIVDWFIHDVIVFE